MKSILIWSKSLGFVLALTTTQKDLNDYASWFSFLCLSSFPGSIAAITVTVIAVVLLVFGVAAYLKIRWEAPYSSLWRKVFHFVGLQANSCFAECLFINKCLSSQKYWQVSENGQCAPHWTGIDGTVSEPWQSRRSKLKYTVWWCNGMRVNLESGDWGLCSLLLTHLITVKEPHVSWPSVFSSMKWGGLHGS